jgi:hypothetical protein
MSRRTNVEKMQNNTLNEFERTLTAEKWRSEPNQIERTIAKSAERREEWSKNYKETPVISVYNPNSALANFGLRSAEEQRAINKRLKAEAKSSK